MIKMNPGTALGASAVVAALLISGCSSSRFGNQQPTYQPQQLQPVANSQVQSQALPPLSGQPGQTVATANTGVNANGQFNSQDPMLAGQQGQMMVNADGTMTAVPNGGTLTANANAGATGTTSGRDLSGPLTTTKLLGTWTLMAGVNSCRLNLTQTAKPGTNHYRASAPGCADPVVSGIAAWQLTGSQIQLYDASGALIGSLLRSGDRFLGTMSGGTVVSIIG